MKTVKDTMKIEKYNSKAFNMYLSNKTFAVFDIETTGLASAYCKIILSGILLYSPDTCQTIQFFAEEESDEEKIIRNTLKLLDSVDYILTYNGKHFDIPFLKKRCQLLGIDFDFSGYNLDLYLVLNGHSSLKEILPNLKQKSVENFMGLSSQRQDQISGQESVDLYKEYLKSRSSKLEERIILHNHDDLIQLCKLLPIIDKCDFHKAMFKLGFPGRGLNVEKIFLSGKELIVQGSQLGSPKSYLSFATLENPYALTMEASNRQFSLKIPCMKAADCVYLDALSLLGEKLINIKKYPSLINGYLIIFQNGQLNYLAINSFLLEFLPLINQS